MDTALAKFRQEHTNCEVDELLVDMESAWYVTVMVVPSNKWEANTSLDGRFERKLVATLEPVTPLEQWPLVTADVYMLSSEHVYVHMTPALDEGAAPIAPTEAHKFTEVRPTTCTKIGTATLSSLLCPEHKNVQLGDYLQRSYQVDLTFQADGKIYESSYHGIHLTFNACKKKPRYLTRGSTSEQLQLLLAKLKATL